MNKIHIVLASILVISMLAIGGMAASGGVLKPTPVPTSTAEAVQDQRLTALEANDTSQNINNTEQQSLINTLSSNIKGFTDQINQLINRVTNLENNPYPATYTMFDPNLHHVNRTMDNGCCYDKDLTEVANYTFNLPKASYVNIEISGQFYGLPGIMFETFTGVDNDFNNGYRGYSFTQLISPDNNQSNFLPYTGFQILKGYYLSAGDHTVQLKGIEWAFGYPEYTCTGQGECAPWVGEVYISVLATDTNKGNFQQLAETKSTQEIKNQINRNMNIGINIGTINNSKK